ncbi:MAG TPA: hypothetical protein VGB14_17535 [Acidimicrobiales bacterium]
MTDALTVAVLALVAVRLVSADRVALSAGGRARTAAIVRSLRPRHFLLAPPVLALVVAAVVVLTAVPGLDVGWWTAVGGIGNPVTGSTEQTTGTALEWLVPAVFLALLAPALPLFAESEERIFRAGSERRSWAGRAGRAVLFGLAHAIVGIPIGAALALSIGGAYFTWAYLRGHRRGGPAAGLRESTCAHVAYNAEVLAVVLLGLVATALG